jgi:hypothetical protein
MFGMVAWQSEELCRHFDVALRPELTSLRTYCKTFSFCFLSFSTVCWLNEALRHPVSPGTYCTSTRLLA